MESTKSRSQILKIIVTSSIVLSMFASVEGVLLYRQTNAMNVVFEQRRRLEALGFDVTEPPDRRYFEASGGAEHPIIADACDVIRKYSTRLRPLSDRLADPDCFADEGIAEAMDAVNDPLAAAIDHILAVGDRPDDDILPAKILDGVFLAQAIALFGARSIRAGRESEADRAFDAAFLVAHVSGRRPTLIAQLASISAWNHVERTLREELERFADPLVVASKVRFDLDRSLLREAAVNEARLVLWSLSRMSSKDGLRIGSLLRGKVEENIRQVRSAGDLLRQQADFLEADGKLADPADVLRLALTRPTEVAFNNLVLFENQRLCCRRIVLAAQVIGFRRKTGRLPTGVDEMGLTPEPISPLRHEVTFEVVPEGIDLRIDGGDTWTLH